MQTMEDYWLCWQEADEASTSAEYKRECQSKSGADAIIQGVLPFLEKCKPQLYVTLLASNVATLRPPNPTVDMEPPVLLFQAPYTQ